ncbi:MAG TPA: BBP7 family outer membrane beta-barrel protein [Gemmataceae bacterium]|nr:BBP7 family outer membrane beta-barrel protein [Gemmataceae bacterium]
MRHRWLRVLAVWLVGTAPLFAQPAANDSPKAGESPKTEANGGAKTPPDPAANPTLVETVPPHHGWVQAEYLLWWVKTAPLPVPIVTTGDPRVGFDPNQVNTVNTAGAIGQPGTQVLLGDHNLSSRLFSGGRLGAGYWVDDEDVFGIEGTGFALEHETNHFAVASDKAGNPPLYFPIFSETVGTERAIPIADPLRSFSGNVVVNTSLRLWGAEANGIVTVIRNSGVELLLLAGFRYADLTESLQIYNTTTDLIFDNVTSLHDAFFTHNQFFGGQLGSRLAIQGDCFSLDLTGKVALGSTHQVVDVQGAITQLGPNPLTPPGAGTFPGGLFAQPSNIGQRSADPFTVLSSVELKLGYPLSARCRAFVGYELMYWDDVVRPGNQINHAINSSQNAVLGNSGTGKLVGPAQPAPLFQRSDFWAQGVNFGLEVRY